MPPRKKADTAPATPKAATPELEHSKDCPSSRVESWKAVQPGGAEVRVVRCQDCGARKNH